MKKTLAIFLQKTLPLLCVVYMLSGCAEMIEATVGAVLEAAVDAAAEGITDTVSDAHSKGKFARQRRADSLDNPAEDRLARRTSTLDGGMPVDVSPYLLQNHSFTVTEEGTRRSESALKITGAHGYLYEFDTVLTFVADKQSYEMNVTVAAADCHPQIKKDNRVKQQLKQFAAGLFGLESNKIRSLKVEQLKRREVYLSNFKFSNVFIQVTESCYFQFDAEVEYQKTKVKKREEPHTHFDVFNKVYRSDFATVGAAALDVQIAIWEDAKKSSGLKKNAPLPVTNFVKAVKVSQ